MEYRAEIDGLRAVAVLPVILFHAGVGLFSGGYVGVDIFFVISGYLITTIIVKEKKEGRFTLVRFYERRARRILPALFLVTLTCIPLAWLSMLPDQLNAFGKSLVAVSTSSSNFLFFAESGYFAPAAELKPLLHTWSLAVEEQFYLVFPLLVILLWRFGMRVLAAVLTVAAVATLCYAQFGGNLAPVFPFIERDFRWFATPALGSYFLPFGRIWELALGALVAITPWDQARRSQAAANVGAVAGVALIAVSLTLFDDGTPFPSVFTLVPTIGTALVIVFATPQTLVGRLLANRFLVGIGLISYSAYLWHQPLFAFARLRSLHEPSTTAFVALGGLALVLAYFSWRWVEAPFRRTVSTRHVWLMAAGTLVVGVASGAILIAGRGFPARFDDDVHRLLRYQDHAWARRSTCEGSPSRDIPPEQACRFGADTEPSVVIWGDSHAGSLAYSLGEWGKTKGLGVTAITYAGCLPIRGLYRVDQTSDHRCSQHNDRAFDYIARTPSIRYVVLAARWSGYVDGTPFDNGEGGREFSNSVVIAPTARPDTLLNDDLRTRLVLERITQGIQEVAALGRTTVLVYPIPEVGWNVPRHLARAEALGVSLGGDLSTSYPRFLERNALTFQALDAAGASPGLVRVHPGRILCDAFVRGRCVAQLRGVPLYTDDHHLGIDGSRLVIDDLARVIAAMPSATGTPTR